MPNRGDMAFNDTIGLMGEVTDYFSSTTYRWT